jgi:peroxiredoxin
MVARAAPEGTAVWRDEPMTDDETIAALRQALHISRALDAPLDVQLRSYVDSLRRIFPSFSEAVDRLVHRLENARAGASAPKVGERMPEFLLPDETGHLVSLTDLVSKGPAVVAFHRGHWCPYCQINARALAKLESRVHAEGGEIVAITPEVSHYSRMHKASARAGFKFLSDIDNGYALSLDLAIWVGDEMKQFMTSIGRELDRYQGNPGWMLPIPATFVVGSDGNIVARFVDPDYRRRVAVERIVNAVRRARAQYPANSQP